VREWLSASGSLSTIQARLRADLYAAIQEQASDPTLRLKPKEGKGSVDAPTRCLNWLVGQHLSSQKCWLTTSLMASEAQFPEFGPPRAGVEGRVGERGKQYCTEILSKEKLGELLETLKVPDEAVEEINRAYFLSPQVSLLSLLLFSLSKSTDASSNTAIKSKNAGCETNVPSTDQEDGVEAKLCRIEGKYEKILQQVEERRRGLVKSVLGETSPPSKEETLHDMDLMVLNRELKRKEELMRRERRKGEKEVRRREKMLRRQESLDTSSSTVTVAESDAGAETRKQSKEAKKAAEKDKTIQQLCQKMEEFLVSQEKEREQSLTLAKRLALAEEELKHFQEKEKHWEEEKRRGENDEDMAKMTQLVSQQMSKLAEQAKLIQDLRVQVEVGRVERKVNEQEDTLGKHEKTAASSPTEDFLRQTKERVEELSREQMEIDDEFEDFNQTSLKE